MYRNNLIKQFLVFLFYRPKNGDKLCGGENGLYETKVFYFKRPDDPDNFYSKNISEYGDW